MYLSFGILETDSYVEGIHLFYILVYLTLIHV